LVELKISIKIVWWILSAISIITACSIFILPDEFFMKISCMLSSGHGDGHCILCGMTRASIAISKGDLRQAIYLNKISLTLFSLLLLNSFAFLIFAGINITNFIRRKSYAYC